MTRRQIVRKWKMRASWLWFIGQWKPTWWDCSVRTTRLVNDMCRSGLEAGVDFAAIHGRIDGIRHTCLELYGERIDPASPGVPFDKGTKWVGKYERNRI